MCSVCLGKWYACPNRYPVIGPAHSQISIDGNFELYSPRYKGMGSFAPQFNPRKRPCQSSCLRGCVFNTSASSLACCRACPICITVNMSRTV